LWHLWSILKHKYDNFNLDDTLRELQEFFKMVANRVNQMGTKIQVTLKEKLADDDADADAPLTTPKPDAELTPMPELQEVNGN
ncbi:hypothetical protein V3C99_015946, partial [Haemonchus contortus]|uniref:PRESAN domain-containing protein n=1 Tax=Haemonchus contortus TaxID=6289 RepID=A0A7I4YYD6_HAECO